MAAGGLWEGGAVILHIGNGFLIWEFLFLFLFGIIFCISLVQGSVFVAWVWVGQPG